MYPIENDEKALVLMRVGSAQSITSRSGRSCLATLRMIAKLLVRSCLVASNRVLMSVDGSSPVIILNMMIARGDRKINIRSSCVVGSSRKLSRLVRASPVPFCPETYPDVSYE